MLNLYNILLEHIDCNQLIEEGKDPVEVLHYKFQNVPSDIIDSVIAIDPTKKKSYSQWVLSKWDNEDSIISKAIENGRLEKLFQFFKEHQEKQIKDCPSVSEGLDAYVPKVEDTVLDKSSDPETYVLMLGDYVDSDLANDFDIVFNEDNWLIAVPNTFEASCKLGENCWWCTANHFGGGDSYYRQYLNTYGGKYYINFDLSQGETLSDRTTKEYPYTRYQFHFETRQFKAATEGEPDVSLEDLNIPQSAIDFYHEIDENYNIGEKSEEEKMEEYENQRWDDCIRLCDDLYLNTFYNEDYEYEHPTENSNWYVFDTEDDRDPLSYTEVNPNLDESLVYESEDNLYILREKYDNDEYLLLTSHDSENRWRNWGSYSINYFLPFDNFVFTVIDAKGYGINNSYFTVFYTDNESARLVFETKELSKKIVNISKNDNIVGNDAYNIEVTYDDGYHSLIQITLDDIDWIIKRDEPINGEYYEIDENGIIHGKFRDYSVNIPYDTFGDENYYHLTEKLSDEIYLVEKNVKGKDRYGNTIYKLAYNIFDKNRNGLIFDFWADNIEFNENGYIITMNDEKSLYDFDGKPTIEGKYDNICTLVEGSGVIACINKEYTDLIDANTKERFARFKSIDTNYRPKNNKIIVRTYSYKYGPNMSKVYDYSTRQFAYLDSVFETPIFSFGSSFIACSCGGNNYIIRDYSDEQDIEIEVDKIAKEYGIDGKRLIKNEKKNIISPTKLILPVWCDDIIDVSDAAKFITVQNNGKYFYFDLETNDFNINPNGFDYYPYDDRGGVGGIAFKKQDENGHVQVQVNYSPQSNSFFGYTIGQYRGQIGEWEMPEHEEIVMNFINELTGQNQQPSQQETQEQVLAMAEQFKRMLKRIDEARRLNYN